MNESKLLLMVVILINFFSNSCRSPNSPTLLRAPNLQTPVATGIFITNETGPDIIGIFGNPSSNAIAEEFRIEVPYPNPNNGSTSILFSLAKASLVNMYIVPANFITQDIKFAQFSNALINLPGGLAIDEIIYGFQAAGQYSITWRGRNRLGQPFPDGFYRIYLEIEDQLLWQDVLLLRDPGNAPSGLPSFDWL